MSRLIKLEEENSIEILMHSEGKKIINFWTEWCGSCKLLNTILEELSNEEDTDIYSVDLDNNPSFIEKFKIENIPCILVFRDGKVTNSIQHIMVKEELRKELFD